MSGISTTQTDKKVIPLEKRERVIAAIRGEAVDHVPCGFSLHFPKSVTAHEAVVKEHLDFFTQTDTDIAKIMNENLLNIGRPISTLEELAQLPHVDLRQLIDRQAELTRDIKAQCDPQLFLLGTLHGICASSIHPMETQGMEYLTARNFILNGLRQNEAAVLPVLEAVCDWLCEFAKSYAQAGVDGIYYASLGGERDLLTDEEFEKWIKPFDLRVMQTIRETGCYCFLHICKDGLNMERYRDFAPLADVVNWGIYEAPCSLEEGKKLFGDCTIMGGLPNRSGVMTEGTQEQLDDAVRQLVSEKGKTKFILGADCTLPSEISWSRIRSISDTVHTI